VSADLEWSDPPALRRPILVTAYRGLFDASGAATDAVLWLRDRSPNEPVGAVNSDRFFDFQVERPTVELDASGVRELHWPENRLEAVMVDGGHHDLIVTAGVEPHLRWGTFAEQFVEVVRRTGAELVVTLGAMPGMAPHTRPLGVIGSSTDADLARRLGLGSPSYQGPTGVVGVMHDALDKAGLAVVSLRVSVPHYVPGAPNPEATRSILRRFELMTGVPTGHEDLDEAAREWRRQVDEAVARDPDVAAYVGRLEQEVDARDDLLPSGDALANQLEAFLRERHGDAGDGTPSVDEQGDSDTDDDAGGGSSTDTD
jgi:proteasome assembly chaperone (PAC2) family protein